MKICLQKTDPYFKEYVWFNESIDISISDGDIISPTEVKTSTFNMKNGRAHDSGGVHTKTVKILTTKTVWIACLHI